MKVAVVVGTRPEIIKLAPIVKELQRRSIEFILIHSNQHYSRELDGIFFEELKLPSPDYNLGVGSGMHGNQTGNILLKIEPILEKEKPNHVLVQGDTNTVLAAALAASKLGIKVTHIEAGLRSYDRKMPEETNRVVTDHCSDYLMAVSDLQKSILTCEGISEDKIFVSGNTITDTLWDTIDLVKSNFYKSCLDELKLEKKNYFLFTAHRASNVDKKGSLEKLVSVLESIAEKYKKEIIWPIHPRTKNGLETFNIKLHSSVRLLEPQSYSRFVELQYHAELILTDSGGIQEEACILKVPCVTLRENTERPESIEVGANILAGLDKDKILEAMDIMLSRECSWQSPFGKRGVSRRILSQLLPEASQHDILDVSVVGQGYMGFPISLLIADAGHRVTGIDISQQRVDDLNLGLTPFEERGLDDLHAKVKKKNAPRFSTKHRASDIYLVSVPTNQKDEKCDLRHVLTAVEEISKVCSDKSLIIIESTIAPGTCQLVKDTIFKNRNVYLAHAPERAIPGNTLYELYNNERTIGGLCDTATSLACDFYKSFVKGKIHPTSAKLAECVKLLENTYRDVNIALANEIDEILLEHKVDSSSAISFANKHPRVNILKPGPGVGGHCIPIDPYFLVQDSKAGSLVRLSRKINNERPKKFVEKYTEELKHAKRVALLGVAYKANVDDCRESPSFDVRAALEAMGKEVRMCDPLIAGSKYFDNFSLEEALDWADYHITVCEHDIFKDIHKTHKTNLSQSA